MSKKIQLLLIAAFCTNINASNLEEEARLLSVEYKNQLQRLSSQQNLNRFFNMQDKQAKEVITNSLFGQVVQYANKNHRDFGQSITLTQMLYDTEIPLETRKKVIKLFDPEYYKLEISSVCIRIYLEIDYQRRKKNKVFNLLQDKEKN